MSFVNLGFLGGAVSGFVGLIWLMAKVMRDNKKNISLPFALFCWGTIAFMIFFISGVTHFQSAAEHAIAHHAYPFFIFVGIFLGSIPIILWLDEHGWKDKTLSKLLFAVVCLAATVSFGFYQFMN